MRHARVAMKGSSAAPPGEARVSIIVGLHAGPDRNALASVERPMAPVAAPSPDSLPRFGQYRILRSIAAGGMGEIFLAKRVGPGGFEKLVALKRMLPHLMRDERSVAMFLNEAKLAAQLNHANVVQIFDFGRLGDTYFISMEYVHGKNLRDILDRVGATGGVLPLEHALGIVREACAGLGYAHGRSAYDGTPLEIIHRDVSPQNVLVSFDGEVKITDFGIAKASLISSETTAGTVKGKLSYMSPEQISGDALDHRSDLFSVGVILFELLTGRKLFPDDVSLPETIERIQQVDVPMPRDVNPDIPVEVEDLLLKALARSRNERFQSGREMELAIADVMTLLGLVSGPHERARFLRGLFAESESLADWMEQEPPLGLGATPAPVPPRRVTSAPGPLPGSEPVSLSRFLLVAALVVGLFVGGSALVKRFGWKGADDAGAGALGAPTNATAAVPQVVVAPSDAPEVGPNAGVSGGAAGPSSAYPAARPVEVTSRPPGAAIWLDGSDTHKTTPARLEVAVGRRSIRLEKDGYDPRTTPIVVDANAPGVAVEVELVPKPVTVQIATDPAGASVSIGPQVFTSPQTVSVKPGRYTVRVEKAGFQTIATTVNIEAARANVLRYELRRASLSGLVTLNTEPFSIVYEDGQNEPLGQTPLVGHSTSAGIHRFRFVNPQVDLDETVSVDVLADDHVRKLFKFAGTVVVDDGVRELRVDGKLEPRRRFELSIGSHPVRMVLADGRTIASTVRVRHGQEVHVP